MSPDDQSIDMTSSINDGQIYLRFQSTRIDVPDPTTQGQAAGLTVTQTVRGDRFPNVPQDPPEAIPRVDLLI